MTADNKIGPWEMFEIAKTTQLPNHGFSKGAQPACFVPKLPSGVEKIVWGFEGPGIYGFCGVCGKTFEFISGKGWLSS